MAQLLVECLEHEGVEYVFGLPGEENLETIDALAGSSIRFITTRDERGAAFMADTYGALTGRPGVCLATLGPGAINLMLGIANAQLDSHPLVAITAQAGLDRINKESHQAVDLIRLFQPITKWGGMVTVGEAVPEMVRKAFKQADAQVARAVELLASAERAVVLAGPGVARDGAMDALVRFAEALNLPVATTFLGKGVFPDDHPNSLGTIGFMVRDYANFGFDEADVVVTVGYDLVEYAPDRWNPRRDKRILHIHRTVAEVDDAYTLEVGIQGDIGGSLDAIGAAAGELPRREREQPGERYVREELASGAGDEAFPVRPQRIVHDVREALGRDDIVLCDTGGVKIWMARLFPTYSPNTCLISNGLATMAFSLPGALAAKLVHPERKVLAAMGDGAFLMSAAEIETSVREGVPFVVLVWVDGGYGLIGWKQDIHFGRRAAVSFGNPDFVTFAESFGAKGYAIGAASELLPTLRKALDDDAVSVVAVPVDYSENARLVERLGALDEPI